MVKPVALVSVPSLPPPVAQVVEPVGLPSEHLALFTPRDLLASKVERRRRQRAAGGGVNALAAALAEAQVSARDAAAAGLRASGGGQGFLSAGFAADAAPAEALLLSHDGTPAAVTAAVTAHVHAVSEAFRLRAAREDVAPALAASHVYRAAQDEAAEARVIARRQPHAAYLSCRATYVPEGAEGARLGSFEAMRVSADAQPLRGGRQRGSGFTATGSRYGSNGVGGGSSSSGGGSGGVEGSDGTSLAPPQQLQARELFASEEDDDLDQVIAEAHRPSLMRKALVPIVVEKPVAAKSGLSGRRGQLVDWWDDVAHPHPASNAAPLNTLAGTHPHSTSAAARVIASAPAIFSRIAFNASRDVEDVLASARRVGVSEGRLPAPIVLGRALDHLSVPPVTRAVPAHHYYSHDENPRHKELRLEALRVRLLLEGAAKPKKAAAKKKKK